MEIAPGIHQLKVPIPDNPLGYLNCYLVKGNDGWLMIDTGWHTPDAYAELKAGLKSLGLATTDISTIVITHVHPDHFGLAGRIKASSPKTQLFMHRFDADLIESRYIKLAELRKEIAALLRRHGTPEPDVALLQSASMPTLQYVIVTLPEKTLYGGEIISTGIYDLEVIWTPGHSPGHICLYEPKNQLLFSGDHVLPEITPNVSYTPQSGDNPLGDFIGALRKIQNIPVAKVLPAHERIFTDLRGRIGQIIEHHAARKQEILRVITREPHHAYHVSSQLSWSLPGLIWNQFTPLHRRMAVTETVAHLESMRWEGTATKITTDGVITYRAA